MCRARRTWISYKRLYGSRTRSIVLSNFFVSCFCCPVRRARPRLPPPYLGRLQHTRLSDTQHKGSAFVPRTKQAVPFRAITNKKRNATANQIRLKIEQGALYRLSHNTSPPSKTPKPSLLCLHSFVCLVLTAI